MNHTLPQAARELGCSQTFLRRLVQTNQIQSLSTADGEIFFNASQMDQLREGLAQGHRELEDSLQAYNDGSALRNAIADLTSRRKK